MKRAGRMIFLAALGALVAAALAAPSLTAAPAAAVRSFVASAARALAPEAFPPRAEILFVGDMMFDRGIRKAAQRHGGRHLFSCVAEQFARADLVVGNLEGPVTGNGSVSLGSAIGSPENYVFTFPTSTAPLLYDHNVRLVGLGNNHILNLGYAGARETLRHLHAAGVGFFGDPFESRAAQVTVRGVPLAFVSYNEFDARGWRAAASTTRAQVRAARGERRIPVVYAHWGEEYEPATWRQKELARSFVDSGAEIVIGAHPHVVQESERYNGSRIYYSLGNFLFDQHWEERVRRGLMLRVFVTESGIESVEEVPIVIGRDGRVCPAASL